jgi:hypothetical protein
LPACANRNTKWLDLEARAGQRYIWMSEKADSLSRRRVVVAGLVGNAME